MCSIEISFLMFTFENGHTWFFKEFFLFLSDNKWKTGEDDHFVAMAQYDFKAEKEEELSFSAGQEIKVAPKGK